MDPPATTSALRFWIAPLLTISAISGAIGIFLLAPVLTDEEPRQPEGGILFLTNRDGLSVESGVSARIDLSIWETGFENTTVARMEIRFTGAAEGTQWYVVASGDYRPTDDMPLRAFCDVGWQAYRTSKGVFCKDNTLREGSRRVRYLEHEGLAAVSFDNRVGKLVDFDGYDDDRSTVVTGTVEDPEQPTIVYVPFPTPPTAQSGGDETFSLPQIGFGNYGDYGSLGDLGPLVGDAANPDLALREARTPAWFLDDESLQVTHEASLGRREIVNVHPRLDDPETLVWNPVGRGLPDFTFTLRDEQGERRQTRNAFFAGIALSVAVSALLLLLEQLLHQRERRASAG